MTRKKRSPATSISAAGPATAWSDVSEQSFRLKVVCQGLTPTPAVVFQAWLLLPDHVLTVGDFVEHVVAAFHLDVRVRGRSEPADQPRRVSFRCYSPDLFEYMLDAPWFLLRDGDTLLLQPDEVPEHQQQQEELNSTSTDRSSDEDGDDDGDDYDETQCPGIVHVSAFHPQTLIAQAMKIRSSKLPKHKRVLLYP